VCVCVCDKRFASEECLNCHSKTACCNEFVSMQAYSARTGFLYFANAKDRSGKQTKVQTVQKWFISVGFAAVRCLRGWLAIFPFPHLKQ